MRFASAVISAKMVVSNGRIRATSGSRNGGAEVTGTR
jgi:hypothetical protein